MNNNCAMKSEGHIVWQKWGKAAVWSGWFCCGAEHCIRFIEWVGQGGKGDTKPPPPSFSNPKITATSKWDRSQPLCATFVIQYVLHFSLHNCYSSVALEGVTTYSHKAVFQNLLFNCFGQISVFKHLPSQHLNFRQLTFTAVYYIDCNFWKMTLPHLTHLWIQYEDL